MFMVPQVLEKYITFPTNNKDYAWYSFPRTGAFNQGEFYVYGTSSAGEIYRFPY